ncbi:uncharacterized protein si:dkey-261l7.2 isoform X2 [Brachionichthys hirsutus]|uniref:uncharacterized protein si:dkey-261l7.2 isoform X2 n=1 Tax=Brachionichthys hirsutus TaxID=412623 RepID=UPI003604E4E4
MPELTGAALLQIALLLSAVPAQYLICRWSGSTAVQRFHASARLLHIWKEWRKSFLNATVWMDWASMQMSKVQSFVGLDQEGDVEEDPNGIESMIFENDMGFFGASKEARSPRPPFVFLRVGEVVMERRGHMIGVIVSWDPELRAPSAWVERVYSNSEGLKAENTPHYKVLFSGPRASSVLVAYLPQTQLERVTGTRPDIPSLEEYFTHFDGKRFVMQPWLRELFPEDENQDEEF